MKLQPVMLLLLLFTTVSLLQEARAQYGNTKYGEEALISNTSGAYNTANGYRALYANTTGSNNTAIGVLALGSGNTTGSYNTAIGVYALNNNSSGAFNTATGFGTLTSNSSGARNTASGHGALYSNTTGSYNTASGYQSLYKNTTGNYNTAKGYTALSANTTGSSNTACGHGALYLNNSGYSNTASGYTALRGNTTGYSNMAAGAFALNKNTTGSKNTASGQGALLNNTTGANNTALGSSAGSVSNYNNSTFIGYNTTASPDLDNVTVIGNGAAATASNQVRVGNSAIISIGGKVGWSTLSDGRFKYNIKNDVPGLSFINKLRPVTYSLDIAEIDKASGAASQSFTDGITGTPAAATEKHTGFIAQEVEKAAEEIGYDFSGVDKPKNDRDFYGLRYSEFVIPLVKAVQEMDAANKKKDEKINRLEEELAELKHMVLELKGGTNTNSHKSAVIHSSAYLEQNRPNPSAGSTLIRYYLPSDAKSAKIVIMDARGAVIKSVSLNNTGNGQVTLNGGFLAAGIYTYSLWVAGKQADSKQMVVTR